MARQTNHPLPGRAAGCSEGTTDVPRLGGYRTAGGLEVRTIELEQELTELRARYREADRERWRARRSARAYKAALVTTIHGSSGGLGAAVASVVALGLHVLDIVTTPSVLLGIVIFGSVLRILLDARHAGIDDDFPEAPPPRMFY